MTSETKDQKHSAIDEMPGDPPVELGETQKVDHRQADVAAAYLNNSEQYEALSPEEARKMKRKTDWILLPMVSFRVAVKFRGR